MPAWSQRESGSMSNTVKHAVLVTLARFDNWVKAKLDAILPQNLTFRYIGGLSCVALMAIFGQILIQSSIAKQRDHQRSVRTLDRLVLLGEELRKGALNLQLASSKP